MDNKEDLSRSKIESVFQSNIDIKIEDYKFLDLSFKMLTNIESLTQYNLENLTHLYLNDNNIKRIEGLENLKNLEYLDLSSNHIEKIEGLERLTNLEELHFEGNKIKRIEGLDNLINLRTLSFGDPYHYTIGNDIEVIENLDTLTKLDSLELGLNKITEIFGLEKLIYLVYLGLSCNQILEIKGLNHNPMLTHIDPLHIPEEMKLQVKQQYSYWGNDQFVLRRDLDSYKGLTFNPEKSW